MTLTTPPVTVGIKSVFSEPCLSIINNIKLLRKGLLQIYIHIFDKKTLNDMEIDSLYINLMYFSHTNVVYYHPIYDASSKVFLI